MDTNTNILELNVLKNFFDKITAINPQDNSISDSKVVRDTQNQLKVALRGATQRCSCAKRSYGICEVCQGSSDDLITLRNFFRVIRTAKKHDLPPSLLQEFIQNTHKDFMPKEIKVSKRKSKARPKVDL